jgi:hypothetical protein
VFEFIEGAMIFISYRISDSLDLVGRLDADLTREFGADFVFRDKSHLHGGDDCSQKLEYNAKECPVMLVVIGATWQSAADKEGDWKDVPRLLNPKDWVRKEITMALDAGNIVIPVFLNGTTMPPEGWLANCQLNRLCRKQGEKIRSTEYANDLAKLIGVLRKQCPQLPNNAASVSASLVSKRLPTPPDLYAVPNYILTNTFIGRATELDVLDAWAMSTDPLMVVEGIGGLGKSALTWEWMQKRAAYAIPNLTGRVWWSFYEKGTSMAAFVRHTLAYITGQDPDALGKETSHYERCQELLTELKRQPFLLVLDGFERMLTAYHRWDKAQQRDDLVEANLRECVEPRDGELLQQLLHGSPSKVILSTRLFPSILEDRAHLRPIPGVAHHQLDGLSRPDALAFFKHARIQGNEQAMLEFADQFGRHSLLLVVVCGEMAKYPKRSFHFDAWRTDPNYGGKLKLSELNLKQRYNHILRFALEGLVEQKRRLLCRIAVLSENVTYDTLAVLNPFLPPKPKEVEEPDNPEGSYGWKRLSDDEKQERLADYRKAQDAYRQYQAAMRAHPESAEYRLAILAFDKSLKELQDRGLLQWDRDTGHYDMHPVVRGHAADFLEESDRKQTFLTVRDHFEGLPPDDFEKATELVHVANSVEIYRCLIGAGLLDEAASFYRGDLGITLGAHLGAHPLIVELLTALFRVGRDGLPCLTSASNQSSILNRLAAAVGELGHGEESLALYAKELYIDKEEADWSRVAICLLNMSYVGRRKRRAESANSLALAMDLAVAAGDSDCVSMAVAFRAQDAIDQGRFADGKQLLGNFHARSLPSVHYYRPGEAEHQSCVNEFYQGTLTEADWQKGFELAVQHRNVFSQYQFFTLRSEWLLTRDQSGPALDAIDEALKIANRLGTPRPDYHDLRAWALARLDRPDDARAELANGVQRRYAAEAWRILGDREQARTCALNAYRWAWGEGPPYIHWYELERSRALLKELGEPEPQLPPFDPSKVKPIPYEAEIRAVIARLKAEKSRSKDNDEP